VAPPVGRGFACPETAHASPIHHRLHPAPRAAGAAAALTKRTCLFRLTDVNKSDELAALFIRQAGWAGIEVLSVSGRVRAYPIPKLVLNARTRVMCCSSIVDASAIAAEVNAQIRTGFSERQVAMMIAESANRRGVSLTSHTLLAARARAAVKRVERIVAASRRRGELKSESGDGATRQLLSDLACHFPAGVVRFTRRRNPFGLRKLE
jgi:hypothetical protein